MKKLILIGLAMACFSMLYAQKQFFKAEKMVETGVYYYPEAWNPEQWDRDFKKMADMGLNLPTWPNLHGRKLNPAKVFTISNGWINHWNWLLNTI